MSGNRDYIFVLWGKGFDEIAASIFVAELRRRSLLVKVVGVGGAKLPGTCGLALVPDMTLDKALKLAGQARCVIVPCDHRCLGLLENDPRIPDFLACAAQNQAWLVREGGGKNAVDKLFAAQRILLYERAVDLVLLAQELVGL